MICAFNLEFWVYKQIALKFHQNYASAPKSSKPTEQSRSLRILPFGIQLSFIYQRPTKSFSVFTANQSTAQSKKRNPLSPSLVPHFPFSISPMAKTRPGKRDLDSYTIKGTNKVVRGIYIFIACCLFSSFYISYIVVCYEHLYRWIIHMILF